MICEYLKRMPNYAADDLDSVQEALGLSDGAFHMGLDWCVERGIIVLENKKHSSVFTESYEEVAMKDTASKLSSMLKQPAAV